MAFPGFKAGMTRLIYKEDSPKSHLANTDRITAVTVIETPPVILMGMRTYKQTPYGLKILAEAKIKSPSKHINRIKVRFPDEEKYQEHLKKVEETADKAVQLRAIIHTQPDLTGIGTKKPSIFEIRVGCRDATEGIEWLKERMGKELQIEDFTKPGQYVDVIGITKGKGFQGPVKRHGVTLLQHKSKHTKRGVGSIAPWTPARVQWVIARYGQLGYFRRTEYNKRVMMIGTNPDEINPKGDFIKYGKVRNRYVVLKGSVPGPKKRMVILRDGVRSQNKLITEPRVTYVSKESHMR